MAFVSAPISDSFRAARDCSLRTRWTGAAALMVGAALAGPWLFGYDYVRDDLGAFHAPLRAFYAHQIARGEPFDWMPDLFCGFYLTGEGQLGGYHPLKWMLYRLLPLHWATGLEYLLPYPLLAIGAWFWLRRLVGRADAAAYGALTLACSSFALMRLIHPHAVAVIAHLSWLLWLTDVLFDAHRRGFRRQMAAAQAGIALLTASQLLLGYPQYVWFTWLALGFVGIGRIISTAPFGPNPEIDFHDAARPSGSGNSNSHPRSTAVRGGVALAAAVACGLLLAGIQLLPTVDALGESVRRSAGVEFAATGSWHPLNAVQWIAPYLFVHRVVGENTHELTAYLGAAPLLLAVWACFSRRDDRLGRLVLPALAAAVLAVLLAFGEFGPLNRLMSSLPFVGSFRFPCRAMVLVQFAASVLASVGYARVFGHESDPIADGRVPLGSSANGDSRGGSESPRRFRPMGAVALVCGASWLIALWALAWGPAEIIASPAAVLAGPLLLSLAAGVIIAGASNRRWAATALALFTAADLGYSGLSYSVYAPGALARRPVAPIDLPTGPARIVCDLALGQLPQQRTGNQTLALGMSRADGYAGLEPQRPWWPWPAAFPPELAGDLLRRAAVQWIRQTEESARLRLPESESLAAFAFAADSDLSARSIDSARGPVEHCEDSLLAMTIPARWLAVPNPLPRVRLESLAEGASPSSTRSSDESLVALAALGRVVQLLDRPGRMQFQLETPTVARLVVAESWHRGWQARVDDQPTTVGATVEGFLAVAVPAGRHCVVLSFDPPSLRLGRWLSLGGVIALLSLISLRGLCRPAALPRARPSQEPTR